MGEGEYTPDRSPGVSFEEGVILESTQLASVAGELRFASGRFSFHDGTNEFDLLKLLASAADVTPGYLTEKLVAGGDLAKAIINPGANEQVEFSIVVGTLFSVATKDATDLIETTLETPQDAFASGGAPTYLTPAFDGDYLCLFVGNARVTNNSGVMATAIGLDGINEQTGSVSIFSGNGTGSSVSIVRLNGLTTSSQIYATYRKEPATPGAAQIQNRILVIMRVG